MCQKLPLPSPYFALKVRSDLKENCFWKPQWEVSCTKGQHLPSASLSQGFWLQLSPIQPVFMDNFASGIAHLLTGLVFTENMVLC